MTNFLQVPIKTSKPHLVQVLKRAEQSKTQARLVVDSDVLEQVRRSQAQRDSTSESFDDDAGFEESLLMRKSQINDEDDEFGDEDFLQMEALPDG